MTGATSRALPAGRDITEMRDPRPLLGIVLVLSAGVLWSLQGVTIRLIEEAEASQIIFWRNYGQFVTLILALVILQRGRVLTAFRRAGPPAIIGGLCQVTASVVIIYAFLLTSVANVVFVLGTAPFFAAVLARMLLGERLSRTSWAAIGVALVGVGVMVFQGLSPGHLLGNLYAFVATLGFAGLAVMLRWGRRVEMVPTVCYGGFFGVVAGLVLTGGDVDIPLFEVLLCLLMGGLMVALGMLAFVRGARYVPAGILVFLTLAEIVLAPVWTWIGVGEVPTTFTLAGGAIVLAAILGQSLRGTRRRGP